MIPRLAIAALAATSNIVPALAQSTETWRPQLVAFDESGNLNQPNYRFDAHHTAGGYWQITDTSWRMFAPLAGIDLARCPNALSCPFDEQGRVAGLMWSRLHYLPWVPYNAWLRRDLSANRVLTAAADPNSPRAQHSAVPRGGDSPPGSGAKPAPSPPTWHELRGDGSTEETRDVFDEN